MKQPVLVDNAASSAVSALLAQRRHLGIWLFAVRRPIVSVGGAFALRHGFRHIDLLAELMVRLTDDFEKPLGVFGADDLADWLLHESYKRASLPILVSELEPLAATMGKLQTIAFFRRAKDLDPRVPVIIISHLSELVSAAGFPADRISNIADEEGSWRMH